MRSEEDTRKLTSSPVLVLLDTSNAKPRGTHSAYNTDENTACKNILNSRIIRFVLETGEEFGELNGPPERTFRVVMCGNASVDKRRPNLGVDCYVKTISIDGKNVAIQLWDTAGQERFRSLCKSYFRRADAAILVYDCTVESSFLSVRDWIAAIKESTMRHIPIMICANKIDLRDTLFTKTISTEDGEAVAAAVGVLFAECSALNGINVEGALMNLIRELIVTEDVEISGTGVIVMSKFSKETNNSCCLKN
uniref:Ras family protein n=1 Tax=Wuchereria bancrofti TaxID=6293 RepID=A0A1I8EZC7_WUCBA